MKPLGIFLAVALHLGLLLFGRVFFMNEKSAVAQKEELIDVEPVEEEAKKDEEEKPEEKKEEAQDQAPPEEVPQFQSAPIADNMPAGPALDQLSAGDLESLLGGGGGDASFGGGGGLAGGGVFGGVGGAGGGDGDGLGSSQLDQKPRLISKVDPKPPAQVAKTLPQVTLTNYIDAAGNVIRAEITPAVDSAAQKAIVDAALRWKYEPGQRNGKKVGSKVSHRISFQS
jgi:hypothetical protein